MPDTPSSDVLERVARAINNARFDYEADDAWEPTDDELRIASAAIAAMPTIERLSAELRRFIDIMDGTDETGFDPHVEQMLMDATETARAALTHAPRHDK